MVDGRCGNKSMTVAFIQPFSLEGTGGGARILRSLIAGRTSDAVSINTGVLAANRVALAAEHHVPARPHCGRVESTRLAPLVDLIVRKLFATRFRSKLKVLLKNLAPDSVHAVAHFVDFYEAFICAQALKIRFTLCVHDDPGYIYYGSPLLGTMQSKLREVWSAAHRRIVISDAMGQYYCNKFDERPFEVFTDGLTEIASQPVIKSATALKIYFMGSMHLSYAANFRSLTQAAKIIQERSGINTQIICRGGGIPEFEDNPHVTTLPWASQQAIAQEICSAHLLYLPLPFGEEFDQFVKYSFPTKLITYSGSGIPILFHGPLESSSAAVLRSNAAALCVHELNPETLVRAITSCDEQILYSLAKNSLEYARRTFDQAKLSERFWAQS